MAGDPPKDSPEGDGKKDAGAKVKKEDPPPEPPLSPEASLRRASSLLEKAVSSREARLAARALRLTAALKCNLDVPAVMISSRSAKGWRQLR